MDSHFTPGELDQVTTFVADRSVDKSVNSTLLRIRTMIDGLRSQIRELGFTVLSFSVDNPKS